MAVLYHHILKRVKITSNLVLLREKQNGDFPREVPMSDWFDRLIVVLTNDSDTLWIDPASRTSRFGELPVHDQGVEALVIAGDKTKFIRTPAASSRVHQS